MLADDWREQERLRHERNKILRMWGALGTRRSGRRPTPQETIAAQMMAQDRVHGYDLTPESAAWGSPFASTAATDQFRARTEREWQIPAMLEAQRIRARTEREWQIPAMLEAQRMGFYGNALQGLGQAMPPQMPLQPVPSPKEFGWDPTAVMQQGAAVNPMAMTTSSMMRMAAQYSQALMRALQAGKMDVANTMLQALSQLFTGRPAAPTAMSQ